MGSMRMKWPAVQVCLQHYLCSSKKPYLPDFVQPVGAQRGVKENSDRSSYIHRCQLLNTLPHSWSSASQAFLKTTNAIIFADEDKEVQHPDHSRSLYIAAQINDIHIRRALVNTGTLLSLIPTSTLKAARIPLSRIAETPIEVFGFAGIHECTIRNIQLVLKVGPIVALTRFHVIDSPISYHALLGRPWLYKHKLVPSTYYQCVKGRFHGKPIRIPANPTPFDLSEAHYFEATFYDELTPSREDSTSRPVGTPLPSWQDIENNPKIDMRPFLDQRKKKRECGETSNIVSQPRCVQV